MGGGLTWITKQACLLDSLQRVGAIPDDKQITYLRIEDGEMPPDCPFEKGQVTIELEHAD